MAKALNGVILTVLVIGLTTAACHSTSTPAPVHSPAHHTVIVAPSPTTVHTAHTALPPTKTPSPTTAPVVTPVPSSGLCQFRYHYGEVLPDPKCTPGSIQSSDTSAICTPGWSAAHREYFTKQQREEAFAKYGIQTTNPAGYGEYDHLIPLELGGSNNPDNLWPEKGKIPNPKDTIENILHNQVCSGKITLRMAQLEISDDWTSVPDTFQAS